MPEVGMMDARQANNNYGLVAGGQIRGTVQNTIQGPATLASAISGFEQLNQRLSELLSKAHQLASMVGGPFPVGGDDPKAAQDGPVSAVQRLNETSGACHRQVAHIDQCLDAMARSLGT